MGLDISAYSKLKKLDAVYNEDGEPINPETRELLDYDTYTQVCLNPDFPGRADELEDRACYSFEASMGLRAGSYGGYNQWRDQLAEMAGYEQSGYDRFGKIHPSFAAACFNGATGPFSEMINFSDCEGTIGASVAKKLAADFATFQAKADVFADGWFREKYNKWRAAFELAADDGCVCFH